MTFYYKRIFPGAFFGIVFAGLRSDQFPPAAFFIVPVVMVVLAYLSMRKLVFDLMDEVWDAEDALIVRNGKQEDRIALSEIKNVSYSVLVNPPRVTLSLSHQSIFGNELTFCPPVRFLPFSKSPIITELIERIDARRRRF